MNVLIATLGSRGDVQPMVALAAGLRRRGHQIRFAGPTDARESIEGLGFTFVDLGADIRRLLADHPEVTEFSLSAYRSTKRFLDSIMDTQFRTLEYSAEDVDLVVGAGAVTAPSSVAEWKKLPYRIAAYSSTAIPSADHPPFIFPLMGLPRFVNAALWRLSDSVLQSLVGTAVNRNRARLGLAPMRVPSRTLTPPGSIFLAADPELSPPPQDYKSSLVVTGALHLRAEPGRELPEALDAFIGNGPPPVYFGFGSMPDRDPQATTCSVIEAAERSGVRVVLSTGWAKLGSGSVSPSCYITGEVSHDLLFPRLAGVVHHGGAGTTAAAALAGVPQLLAPHLLDQFYWAERVAAMQLGPRALRRRGMNTRSLAAKLSELVANDTFRQNARLLGSQLQVRDAVCDAVTALEKSVRKN